MIAADVSIGAGSVFRPDPYCAAVGCHYIWGMDIHSFLALAPSARFAIGDVVRHRLLDFRGVIFDVDPEFANSDEWYEVDPRGRCARPRTSRSTICSPRMPNRATSLMSASRTWSHDEDDGEVDHPAIDGMFDGFDARAATS